MHAMVIRVDAGPSVRVPVLKTEPEAAHVVVCDTRTRIERNIILRDPRPEVLFILRTESGIPVHDAASRVRH